MDLFQLHLHDLSEHGIHALCLAACNSPKCQSMQIVPGTNAANINVLPLSATGYQHSKKAVTKKCYIDILPTLVLFLQLPKLLSASILEISKALLSNNSTPGQAMLLSEVITQMAQTVITDMIMMALLRRRGLPPPTTSSKSTNNSNNNNNNSSSSSSSGSRSSRSGGSGSRAAGQRQQRQWRRQKQRQRQQRRRRRRQRQRQRQQRPR